MNRLLWQPDPDRRQDTHMHGFWRAAEKASGRVLPDYAALHQWSLLDQPGFWRLVHDYCDLQTEGQPEPVRELGEHFRDTRWFSGLRLNFAANLLRRRDQASALIAIDEAGNRSVWSFRDLHEAASRVAAQLSAAGIGPGDRVAAWLPNGPETVITALGSAWVGAIWSSCSPDFGVDGVLDRFGQIEPRVLLVTDGYQYNGKWIGLGERVARVRHTLNPELVIQVPAGHERIPDTLDWGSWLDGAGTPPPFAMLPFDHPLYILYSSGTTGKPKCIVHGAGGTLIQHAKELRLHTDLHADDRLFYFTTCGWMMWNWLVSGLQAGACIVLYDGNPAWPGPQRLFDLTDAEGITHFGASARYFQAIEKAGLVPCQSHDLESLRVMLSTGSPLLHESFDYLYEQVKTDMQVSSISGGTDIVSCFALGNPLLPVYRGELQCAGLGMDVAVFDQNGLPLEGEKGELVCRRPFPCMPVYFWNDPDGQRYHNAYFTRFDNIWAHGDYAEICRHDTHFGLVIHGRSDAVLNPGGVRIGTAEIYRQVETLPEIRESLVVGQRWQDDERVVLFVVPRDDVDVDEALRERIRQRIRERASPRHVPARIIRVAEIPRTTSGKVVELAVREVIHQRPVSNRSALANPRALDQFHGLPELSE